MELIYEDLTNDPSSRIKKYLQVLVDQDIGILVHDDMFYHGPGHKIRRGLVVGKLIGIGYYELDNPEDPEYKTMVHLIVNSDLFRSNNQWCSYHELKDSIEDIRKFSLDKFKDVINELLIDHHNRALRYYQQESPEIPETVQLLK